MQIVLHPSDQEQSTGTSVTVTEPDVLVRSLVIQVTAISVNLLGNVTFKLQHSGDGSTWLDVPGLVTSAIAATGNTTISISPSFNCFNNLRVAWTFNNATSVTFFAAILGTQ